MRSCRRQAPRDFRPVAAALARSCSPPTRHRPDELSGGEMQRVGCRALVTTQLTSPTPTDPGLTTGEQSDSCGAPTASARDVVMVTTTTRPGTAARKITMRDGRIVSGPLRPRLGALYYRAGVYGRHAAHGVIVC